LIKALIRKLRSYLGWQLLGRVNTVCIQDLQKLTRVCVTTNSSWAKPGPVAFPIPPATRRSSGVKAILLLVGLHVLRYQARISPPPVERHGVLHMLGAILARRHGEELA